MSTANAYHNIQNSLVPRLLPVLVLMFLYVTLKNWKEPGDEVMHADNNGRYSFRYWYGHQMNL